MKNTVINGKRLTYYGITDVAVLLGVNKHTLWERVRRGGSFPPPTHRIGNRDYYSATDVERLRQEFGQKEAVQS